jgi:hypothetical protein
VTLSVKLNAGLPARGSDSRLEAEPPDDLFDVGIDTLRCDQMRRCSDASTSVSVHRKDPMQHQNHPKIIRRLRRAGGIFKRSSA